MAINYPASLDTLTNPSATDKLNKSTVPHATQHSDANDAIEALQAKVGVDSSAVATSLDYLLTNSSSANPGHTHSTASLTAPGSNEQLIFNDNGAFAGSTGLCWDKTNSRFGIGTTTPATQFHIKGANPVFMSESTDNAGFAGMNLRDDSAALVGSMAYGNSGAPVWQDQFVIAARNTTAPLVFATNGTTERMRITPAGNVGIGTTTPDSPLNVKADNAVTASPLIRVEQDGTGDSCVCFTLTGTEHYAIGIDNSDGDKFKISQSQDVGSAPKLVISSGDVGLSTSTPSTALHLAKTDSAITIKEHSSAPGTPTTGDVAIYAKTDGKLYIKDDAGTETDLTSGGGGPGQATQAQIEAETDADVYIPPDLIKHTPGSSKSWAYVTISGGTPTLSANYNVSSITDNGAGDYTVNHNNNFSSANYSYALGLEGTTAAALIEFSVQVRTGGLAAGSARIEIFDLSALADPDSFSAVFYGDQ